MGSLLCFLAIGASAQNDTSCNGVTTCTEACFSTQYTLCTSYQTTCETAIAACQSAGGSVEDECIQLATTTFTNAINAWTDNTCTCDISCSGSTMITMSVMALIAKFLF